MMNTQQHKLLRARLALAFYETYGRRPTDQELAQQIRRAAQRLPRSGTVTFVVPPPDAG